jgi:hypothetical protein
MPARGGISSGQVRTATNIVLRLCSPLVAVCHAMVSFTIMVRSARSYGHQRLNECHEHLGLSWGASYPVSHSIRMNLLSRSFKNDCFRGTDSGGELAVAREQGGAKGKAVKSRRKFDEAAVQVRESYGQSVRSQSSMCGCWVRLPVNAILWSWRMKTDLAEKRLSDYGAVYTTGNMLCTSHV